MRGQITVFIIIGLLVVVAFGITLYVGGKMRENIEATPSDIHIEQVGVRPVFDYVTTCLQLAVNDGIALLGRQGGAIYEAQGGAVNDASADVMEYADVAFEDLKIKVAVIPPQGNVCQDVTDVQTCSFFSQPPKYPFGSFPYAGGQTLFFGYYGENTLPALYRGINPETGQPVTGSLQESLESFIAERTVECADFSSFENRFTFSTGNPEANLLVANQTEQFVGEQNLNVELHWPVEVTAIGGEKTVIDTFAVRVPVRLASAYYTVKNIVDSDVTDVSYKPSAPQGFTVNTVPVGDDSVVVVQDKQSVVQGKPFEFWVARRNRLPALWQIDTGGLDRVTFHVTLEGNGAKIDVVPIDDERAELRISDPCQDSGVPNPYVIPLRASDPDENPVTFTVDIPGTSSNEIPKSAIGFDFAITVSAKDGSVQKAWDSQSVPLNIALCPTR